MTDCIGYRAGGEVMGTINIATDLDNPRLHTRLAFTWHQCISSKHELKAVMPGTMSSYLKNTPSLETLRQAEWEEHDGYKFAIEDYGKFSPAKTTKWLVTMAAHIKFTAAYEIGESILGPGRDDREVSLLMVMAIQFPCLNNYGSIGYEGYGYYDGQNWDSGDYDDAFHKLLTNDIKQFVEEKYREYWKDFEVWGKEAYRRFFITREDFDPGKCICV